MQGGKLFISAVALLLSISRPTCCQHGEFHREYILHTSKTENISFIPARRGGFHLKDKIGFPYYKTKPQKAKDRCYWSCLSKMDFCCTATAITQLSTKTLIRLCGNHNHGIKLLENMTQLVEAQKIGEAARMPTVLPRTVLGMYFSPTYLDTFSLIYQSQQILRSLGFAVSLLSFQI